jgi:hypothetical protein
VGASDDCLEKRRTRENLHSRFSFFAQLPVESPASLTAAGLICDCPQTGGTTVKIDVTQDYYGFPDSTGVAFAFKRTGEGNRDTAMGLATEKPAETP